MRCCDSGKKEKKKGKKGIFWRISEEKCSVLGVKGGEMLSLYGKKRRKEGENEENLWG